MTRESDEACLALIASMRARLAFGSDLTKTMAERLIVNLEARIWEHAPNPSYTENTPKEAWVGMAKPKIPLVSDEIASAEECDRPVRMDVLEVATLSEEMADLRRRVKLLERLLRVPPLGDD